MQNTPALYRRGSLRDLMASSNKRGSLRDLMEGNQQQQSKEGKKQPLSAEDSARTLSTRTCSTTASASSVSTASSAGSVSLRSHDSTSFPRSCAVREEDHGVSSAFANQERKKNKKGRSLSFSEPLGTVVGQVSCLADITTEERWETWWCPQEYQAIRLAAKYSTKQIRKCDKSSADSVDAAFQSALHVASLEDNNSDKGGEEDTMASGNSQQLKDQNKVFTQAMHNPAECPHVVTLEQWCTSKLPTRGLEKYVGAAHKKERQQCMLDAKKVVAQLSQQQREQKQKDGHSTVCETEIALTYQEYSRYAILFARLTAHGDVCAARQAQETSSSRLVAMESRPRERRTGRRRSSVGNSGDGSGDESTVASSTYGSDDDSCKTHLQRSFSKRSLLHRQASLKNTNSSPTSTSSGEQPTLARSESRRALVKQESKRGLLAKSDSKRGLMGKQDSKRALLGKSDSKRGLLGKSDSKRGLLTKQESKRGLRRNSMTSTSSSEDQQSRPTVTRRRSQCGVTRQRSGPSAGLMMEKQPRSNASTTAAHHAAASAVANRRDSLTGVSRRDSLDLTCSTTMRSTRRSTRAQQPSPENAVVDPHDPLLRAPSAVVSNTKTS